MGARGARDNEAGGIMFNAEHLIDLLILGWLSNVPLAIGSILTLAVFFDRVRAFRGLEVRSRALATRVIDRLVARDLDGAQGLAEASDLPVGAIMNEALRWQNIALEDYDRILSTLRAEQGSELRRGIWIVGTVGSLAPFVGLFGTVVGIIRAFADLSEGAGGGFAVVATSLSEALIATAAGLGVAIVALVLYNYLNTRVSSITSTYARAAERLVQAILFVESGATRDGAGEEA
jgi:biopolymer transport protein ExbB/TolQ